MEQLSLEQFKSDIHRTLISKLDLEKLSRVNSGQARQAVSTMVNEIIRDQKVPLSFNEQERFRKICSMRSSVSVRWNRCSAIPPSPTYS